MVWGDGGGRGDPAAGLADSLADTDSVTEPVMDAEGDLETMAAVACNKAASQNRRVARPMHETDMKPSISLRRGYIILLLSKGRIAKV